VRQRFIAALVLASLSCWSIPFALASSPQADSSSRSQKQKHAADHACCPHLSSRSLPELFVNLAPGRMPCGSEHPCCVKQAPSESPALPATIRIPLPGADQLTVAILDDSSRNRTRSMAEFSENTPFPSYFERSTVLRI
jgi:hypothetical protein